MAKRLVIWTGVALLVVVSLIWVHHLDTPPQREWLPRLPLHRAAFRGDTAAVARLLAKGANVNAQDEYSLTPLHFAAAWGGPDVTGYLLDHGADVNKTDKLGRTPLDGTVWHHETKDRAKVQAMLLAHGARVENASGKLPAWRLFEAVKSGDPRTVELLLARGADVNVRDLSDRTPLIWATRTPNSPEAVRVLLTSGAAVNAKDKEGRTALHYAAEWGHPQTVRLLLDAGADANARDKNGDTPLILAGALLASPFFARHMEVPGSEASGKAVVSALVKAGADVNARSKAGWTPLIKACMRRDAESVKLLVAAGAQVNAEGPHGWTALQYATAKSATKAVKALTAAGAGAT